MKILISSLMIACILASCTPQDPQTKPDKPVKKDPQEISTDNSIYDVEDIIIDESSETSMPKNDGMIEVKKSSKLENVSDGDASGEVTMRYDGEMYILEVIVNDLPALEEGFFYEGWLLQEETFSYLSTGALESEDETTFSNVFSATDDLEIYDTYVVTLESNNDNPEPSGEDLLK